MLTASAIICPVCGHAGELGNGPGGRPRAACAKCHSLERHRALVGVIPALTEAARRGHVVDVAPSHHTAPRLKRLASQAGQAYVGVDFDPAADNRTVTVQASLTHLPLADSSVGVMVCFHVLEHVPDDARAMAEIARTLAPGGIAVVQVPRRPGQPTEEDVDAPAAERVRRFGQADHVRYYGDDFEERLESAGLRVLPLAMSELYQDTQTDLLGINPVEPVWLCTSGAELDLRLLQETCREYGRTAARTGLAALVAERDAAQELAKRRKRAALDRNRLSAERKKLVAERDSARAKLASLNGRLSVRAANRLGRTLKSLRRLGR